MTCPSLSYSIKPPAPFPSHYNYVPQTPSLIGSQQVSDVEALAVDWRAGARVYRPCLYVLVGSPEVFLMVPVFCLFVYRKLQVMGSVKTTPFLFLLVLLGVRMGWQGLPVLLNFCLASWSPVEASSTFNIFENRFPGVGFSAQTLFVLSTLHIQLSHLYSTSVRYIHYHVLYFRNAETKVIKNKLLVQSPPESGGLSLNF